MAEEYKVSLGIDLNTSDLKSDIAKLDDKYKIKLGVNLGVDDIRKRISDYNKNTNNAKLHLKIKLDTDDLKKQINNLNLDGKSANGVAIPVNTESLKDSFKEVESAITNIKNSLGTLDDKVNTKSLVTAVNQIANALEKATNESDGLVASLRALSNKDFNFNFGINLGGSNPIGRNAAYGNKVRNEALPQLKQQAAALENYFKEYYKIEDGFSAIWKLSSDDRRFEKRQSDLFGLTTELGNSSGSLKSQMAAYKEYIAIIKEAAQLKGIDISSVTSGFSKSADTLVKEAEDIQTGANEMQDSFEKLKGIFSGGIDADGLSGVLEPITKDLSEIKKAFESLSSIGTIDGLTTSFKELAEVLEKLTSNITVVKQNLDNIGNIGASAGNVNNGVENLEQDLKQVENAAENASDAIRETVNESKKLNNISVDISDGGIDDIKNALRSINVDDSDIEKATEKINELNIAAKNVSATFKNGQLAKVDIKGVETTVDGLERAITATTTFGEKAEASSIKYTHAFDKIADAAEKARAGLADTGANGFEYQIESIHKEAEKFVGSSTELREALNRLDNAFDSLNTANEANDTRALADAYEELENAIKQTNSQLAKSRQIEKSVNAANALQQEKAVLSSQMETWLRNNTKAAKGYGDEIRKLQVSLNNLDADGVKEARRQFNVFKQEAKSFEKTGLTAFDSLKKKAKEYATYFSAAELFMYAEEALRSMFEQVKLIDSAMTELKKVTDETDESYNRFLTNAASRAREIGTTIDGLVESTAAFARLGYGFKDAQGLAEVANIYAVVGDEVEGVEGATENLISTMAAFKDEVNGLSDSDFAMSIVDKMNEVANRYSITSGGLGEALQRSASSMSAAQNTLDETIALTTAANEVVQNPEKVGNAMKTISMRIRSAKTEMEEAGIETDGMVESTAKLRSEIMALSGVDIMASATEFKSTYAILDELSKKWEHLSDISQATIIELMAGKHQGNIFASLMQNFDTARSALETSLNSAGSAMKEHEKWQQSLEARILSLKASWQGLSQAFLSSDFLKTTLDGITALVDGITKLIDTFGTIPTLLGLFAGFKGLTNLPKFLTRLSSLTARTGGMTTLQNVISALSRTFPGATKGVSLFTKAIKGLFTAMATHPVIAAAVIAVTALTAAFTYQKKEAEELAEEVETLTSKYKEQHEETQKLKNDYDTSSESSMISKYAKLSKGVDSFGKNVSLTADEYSEYQDIVNTIADQFPSLITGYDEQGNALLSCKGNVEALTEAYEKLVHTQNQEILSTNAADIQKNWENTLSQANGYDFLEKIGNIFTFDGMFGGTMDAYDMKTDTAEWLSKLTSDTSIEEIKSYLNKDWGTHGAEITQVLQNAGYDVNRWSSISKVSKVLKEALEKEPHKIQNILDGYYAEFDESIATYKTKATALLSEAFDVSSDISGLNYGNISEELQNIAYQTVNSLDFDFLSNLTDSGKTIDQWVTEMLNQLNAISKEDNAQIEAAFDLQTQFNGGEISYGEYVKSLKDVQTTIGDLNLKGEAKEQLEISLGLDDDGVIDQYNALVKRLTDSKNYDFNISENEARKLLDGLSSEELAVAVNVITDLSNNNYSETAEEIKTAIERELSIQGLSIELDLEVEKTKLESLSTAISESFSGSGLSEESISAVEGMFSGLNSYDPSKLFERTAHGIRLNSDELRRLNSDYKSTNVSELNKEMDSLGDIYNQTREELYRLTYGTDEYNDKAAELSGIESRINELEQLAAGYEGVASAYQEWQMMESAGSQRDMYENIIAGFETIDDEIKRGWYDDGTIEFLELLSGKDLSTAGIEEVKKAYKGLNTEIKNTGYTVRDFFTVDEDGNSTNTGVYNFLKAIDKLEKSAFGGKDVVKRDGKTNKIIGFDFQVVGGDEVIAETLGISEELVQIMVRAADDAGFVVSMDGTYQQLDILKEKAQEASVSLNKILENNKKKGFDFNFNTSDVDDIKKQLSEAQKILDTFRNTDGTINTKLEGADEALTVASTLQSMLDKLTRPAYMDIEVSNVEDELQEPLRNLQEYRRLIETQNQLKLSGADTTELEASIEESKNKIVDDLLEIQETNPKLAANLEIKGLTREEIEKKVEAGEITIPATVDIQLEMDEKLGILVDKALLDAGIIDGKEFEKRVDIYLNADVNNEDAKSKTEQAVNEITGSSSGGTSSGNGKSSDGKVDKNVDVDVKADKVDTSDIKNKTEEAVKDESSEKLAVETTVELETTIDEALDLIEKFEDKDITIDVKVKGLDSVKELNQNIDLATKIDGSVDKLSEYVEGAKALSELDDNITSYVTANIEGNVTDFFTTEGKLDNLEVFAEGAKALKGVGSFTSKVTADVDGNVIDTPEGFINNLKVFSDSAKEVESIGEDVKAKVTAEINGNVTGLFEEQIDNLKVYSENAKKVEDIGEVTSSVRADVNGNVTGLFEEQIDNLKTYSNSAKEVENIGEVTSSVTADVKGNVSGLFEEQIDNLKVYSNSAKKVEDIGNVESSVTADVEGNVKTLLESQIDNLKVYSDSAKEVESIGDVKSKVTVDIDGNITNLFDGQIDNLKIYSDSAKEVESIGDVSSSVKVDINGNITGLLEEQIDNLKVYSNSAKEVESIGDVDSSVKVNIDGNITGLFEEQIDNLKVYSNNAKEVSSIGNVSSSVTADVNGNITGLFEEQIDNLRVYSDSAKEVGSIGNVSSKVTADIGGNVKTLFEEQIDNLKVYADSAEEVKDIGNVSSKVTADVDGNVIWTPEGMLNNLEIYTESAKKLDGIDNITSEVTANIYGNVKTTSEESIDNLKVYASGAKSLKGVGSFTSEVTANINGNVKNTPESSIDNLGVFADNANKLKNTGNFTSSVAANVSGNVVTDDGVVTDLEHFASVVSGLPSQTVTVSVTANVDSANINQAIDLLTKAANSSVFKDYKATVQVGAKIATIDAAALINYKPPKKDGTVKYKVDSSKVDSWKAPTKNGIVNYSAEVEALTNAQKHKTGTITYKAKVDGRPKVNGTANVDGSAFANGTIGKAYRHGDWGVKKTETALTGELGQELVVYKNRFWTVGDNGAEFATIPKGAIVFNHKQTKELFANGKVTSDGGRGRIFANGTAYTEGTAFGSGSTGSGGDTEIIVGKNSVTGKTYTKSKDSDFTETIDLVEIAISRIERDIDNLDRTTNNVYKSWSERNKALTNQISKVREEINLQQKAYNEYIKAANGVGLSSSWVNKIKNGAIDITTVKDEALADKISDYQKYYEAALDCKDAIEKLKETESSLYAQGFEYVQTRYDGILQGFEHTESMLNEYISQAEEQGYVVSKKYYQALIDNEKKNISTLKQEQAELIAERDRAVNDGEIKKGSEAWYEQCAAIDSVTQAIEEGTTAIIEYNNAIRDIKWETFELIQERISDITAESDFLIELMSNKKLFDDKGKLTSQGFATMSLHGQNYNAYMYQADDYAEQIADIDRRTKLNKNHEDYLDPLSKDVIDKRREYVELQREMILNAEQEKNAIKSLVEDGFDLQLDSLNELIDKYNDALDSQKDLYDYQRKVRDITDEISSLEKQQAAYSGDDSEEAQQKLQQISVELKNAQEDLQETEYDRYIDQQEQLLDALFLEAETIFNERIDNTDALVTDVINGINAAANDMSIGNDNILSTLIGSESNLETALDGDVTDIKSTLTTEAEKVGTTLSNAMSSIWTVGDGSIKSVLSMYGENFQNKQTTTNSTLSRIETSVNNMLASLNKEATTKTTANKTSSSAVKNPTTTSTAKPSTNTPANQNNSTPKITDSTLKGIAAAIWVYGSKAGWEDDPTRKNKLSNKLGAANAKKVQSYINELGANGGLYKYWYNNNLSLDKYKYSAFKLGAKNIDETQLAWTQEQGREYIVRPSDGAILTPVAKGDSVLTSAASNNIWQMANNPAEFIKDNLNLGTVSAPNNQTIQNSYNQTIESIVFSMPNVRNYDEMITQMQRDPNFERLVESMSIGKLAGKSSLAKGKAIR